jgi:hypothetical protein
MEVTDGLYLVVTGPVLHRFICGHAHHGVDVHVRFSVGAIGAGSETRASRIVGRVLTRQDWRADTRRALFASSDTLHRSNARSLKQIVFGASLARGATNSSTRVRMKPGSFF